MKIPAVTMVAAWISADIGVGPSIESGSHTWRGTCADLPMAPTNNNRQITVSNDHCCSPQIEIVVPATWSAATEYGRIIE